MADFSNLFKVETCQHELFPHEEYYIMCPNCGDIIWYNIPKGADFTTFFDWQKKAKWLFNKKVEIMIARSTILIASFFTLLLDPITIWLYQIGTSYGLTTFRTSHRHLPFYDALALNGVFLIVAILSLEDVRKNIKEKYPRHILEERGYDLISSWRPWIKRIILSIVYYFFVHTVLYHLSRNSIYDRIMIQVNDSKIVAFIAQAYYQAAWYYFNVIFLLYLIYVAFCCYRQRLVLKINETDYLNEE